VTLLRAAGVTKTYAGVHALSGVDFELRAGEVHALVGENGAGKSTLIKVLGGAVTPDAGTVHMDGAPLPIGDPRAVRRAGVNIVYQEFTLVADLTIAENLFLGRERGRCWLRRAEMAQTAREVLDQLGLRESTSARVRDLSIAQQQMVEIARALLGRARVLILDEPSATLSSVEVGRLFHVVRELRGRGVSTIYISHRLEEIFTIADRVTVLRDGRTVLTDDAGALDRPRLIRAMVGREIDQEFPPKVEVPIPAASEGGMVVLDVKSLSAPPLFTDVSFAVRAGEIVALAGLVGSGRTSAALALAGATTSRGEIRLNGTPVRFSTPADAIAHGIAYVTEDRKGRGLFPLLGVDANITLAYLRTFARAGLLDVSGERRVAADAAQRFDLRAATLSQPVGTLSGGNQQKTLLARFLLKPRTLVILDEPTRGVDVGARSEIYGLMRRLAVDGTAILMISSDLPEVLGMADRIVVMRGGRTTGELTRAEATAERVMALAS
jgi:ABC-type sugar transport system ATPase subunit